MIRVHNEERLPFLRLFLLGPSKHAPLTKTPFSNENTTWLDAGNHESMADATAFVRMIEERQGLTVSCVEKIAFNNGRITREQLLQAAEPMKKNQYGQHLINGANERIKY